VAPPAAGAPPAGGPTHLLVIQVKSVDAGASADDKAPKGPSRGDRLVERSRLFNVRTQFGRPAGSRVARDKALVIPAAPRPGRIAGVATLPGGRIRFGGVMRLDGVE